MPHCYAPEMKRFSKKMKTGHLETEPTVPNSKAEASISKIASLKFLKKHVCRYLKKKETFKTCTSFKKKTYVLMLHQVQKAYTQKYTLSLAGSSTN